jgi:hypothetical protein
MIGLFHLVWAPLGPAPLREFLGSYNAHPAGAEHELVIVLNGAGPDTRGSSARMELLAELRDTEHRLIVLERPVLDLAAYGQAARQLQCPTVCFLNSYSLILADNWLGKLSAALAQPDVGLAGASGSWESQAEWIRGRARYWPQQLAAVRPARRDYPRFPNPHIRTSAFMLERLAFSELGHDRAANKRATYLLESGRRSITRRIQAQGLRAVVVGRDGRDYDVAEWPTSHTFRSGEQENLLVADNQTRAYQQASPSQRRRLSRDSWGAPVDAQPGSAGVR